MLAVWYMDDGSNNGGDITLNTHSFSFEDQKVIADFLKEKYHLHPTIVKDRNQWKIAIGRNDYTRFISIVTPFIPKVMNYKIDNPRIDLSSKIDRAFAIEAGANTSDPNVENLEKGIVSTISNNGKYVRPWRSSFISCFGLKIWTDPQSESLEEVF